MGYIPHILRQGWLFHRPELISPRPETRPFELTPPKEMPATLNKKQRKQKAKYSGAHNDDHGGDHDTSLPLSRSALVIAKYLKTEKSNQREFVRWSWHCIYCSCAGPFPAVRFFKTCTLGCAHVALNLNEKFFCNIAIYSFCKSLLIYLSPADIGH